MARFRKIDLCIHADEKYRRLTPSQPCGQTLWFHLIVGEQTGPIPGLFRVGEAAFAEQLNWPLEGFREAFREAFREGMVKADWKARLVYVPKAIKYNPPASPNVVLGWRDAWLELPQCELKVEAGKELKAFLEAFGKGFGEAFREAFGESGAGAGAGAGVLRTPLPPERGEEPISPKRKRRRRHQTVEEMIAEDEAKKAEQEKKDQQGRTP
jgi:hypothetical protein